MNPSAARRGAEELAAFRRRSLGLVVFAAVASAFVNLLMLTGPLFMLQIYDRVLGSRSNETLVALAILAGGLYAFMAVLDWARARVMARVGAQLQAGLDERLFAAVLRRALSAEGRRRPATELADVQAVQQFLGAPVLFALFDMPFAPAFAALIFIFHPLLGWLAVGGGAALILISLANQLLTRRRQLAAQKSSAEAEAFATSVRRDAETVMAMGMASPLTRRWQRLREQALARAVEAADWTGLFTSLTKSFRLALQSAMLGLGAWLVLRQELTAGAMIAGSILLGRALAPIEQAIAGWPLAQRALIGWRNLGRLLAAMPPERPRTPLPRPEARLTARELVVIPPGERRPTLAGINFELPPGHALGVIGASAAGKTTLARAITGVWPAASGRIELGGVPIDQYDPDTLGRLIGYLPQAITLFPGTIAENIARMQDSPDTEAVVRAAIAAGAHEMITRLPLGYDTPITDETRLSGGQRQLIGLARALYGEPVLLVLDEPNSNLDAEGSARVNQAIRAHKERGGAAVVIAHRPAAIAECDLLLLLEGGRQKAFGPRDRILREQVRNVAQIRPAVQGDTAAGSAAGSAGA
ncbi:MAG: type I secretion system permease/ATPase [Alphaproteobacteria bacterium]|nr:MAG: type I secretion system permease/ATPase [Alphaproteobacteria bacterium]